MMTFVAATAVAASEAMLAETGSQVAGLVIGGVALLAAAAGILIAAKRRKKKEEVAQDTNTSGEG